MDSQLVLQIIWEVIKQGAMFALLVWVLYWMYSNDKQRNEIHENQMRELQTTFKEAISEVVSSFKSSTEEINKRLDRIETDIRIWK